MADAVPDLADSHGDIKLRAQSSTNRRRSPASVIPISAPDVTSSPSMRRGSPPDVQANVHATVPRQPSATEGPSRLRPGSCEGGGKGAAARELAKAKLECAEVATLQDRDYLSGAIKGDIHSVKVLGEGAFGIVDLVVVDTPKGGLLCVRKKLLKQNDRNNQDPGQEVEFMELCNGSHFVVQMWSYVVGLYDYTLLLEYCPYNTLQHVLNVVSDCRSRSGNGCLDFISISLLHLNHQAGLSESEARFYIACVALGLESMHSKGVLHRDVKPANCLLAHNRYIKVADLGLAKILGSDGRGYTKAGTPGYMAPEVYHSQGKSTGGYSYPADLWSLGIMLWEMVDGVLPKWAYLSWYWTTLHFPDHFSKDLKSLLTGLLDKSPSNRMTIEQMKAHPWFAGFDWAALSRQELVAPCPPELLKVHIHVDLLPQHLRASLVSQKASLYAK